MSAGVPFHKLSGSGNDFVMVDGRTTDQVEWPAERIAEVCDRRNGIGADGLVIIDPAGPGTVRMTYFNSDGSPAPMCGNAAICSTRLAAELGLADSAGMTLVTGAGSFSTRLSGSAGLGELNLPNTDLPIDLGIEMLPGEKSIHFGIVGVPHVAVRVDDLSAIDLPTRGRELRSHPALGEGGANVNFYSRTSGSTGTGADPAAPGWALRTYERGIEAETLSCGTGTVTAALAIAAQGLSDLPIRIRSSSGTVLSVMAQVGGERAEGIWLCGPSSWVASGTWHG